MLDMKHKLLFRRFFASLLLLAVSTLSWAYDFEVDGIYYYKNSDGTSVTVTFKNTSDNSYSGSVTIPATVTYDSKNYDVTSIGYRAFKNCGGLTSIDLPNSVTSIGDEAFFGCSGLTSITIPNSVTIIGSWAFYFCSGLTSISIPNNVTSIGEYAFYNCSGLTSIDIPNSVTSIGRQAFRDCSGLTSVTIPNSVTSIGEAVFYECSGLTSFTIPNSVTSIGSSAFYGCSGLTSITIPNGVTSIGSSTFSGCTGLTSITIPNSVTSIGQNAFSRCSGLTSITVVSGNTKYDSRNDCNAIIETSSNTLVSGCKNTIIPNTVTSIGFAAFGGCSGLTSITIPNSVTSIGNYAFENCSGLTSITIPESVTSIGQGAFSGCAGLTSVTIPEGVTSIGSSAFADCSGLTSIYVDSNNSVYDSRNNCNAIIEIATNTLVSGCKNTTIPVSVTSIAYGAFSGCSGLTSITIPESVTNIDLHAFSVCSGLTSINVAPGNTKYDSRDNCNAIINTTTNTLFIGCKSSVIPESVTSIGQYAFENCSGLTSITIPNSVTSIDYRAFSGCSGLTSVTIPESVTSIGWLAFGNCSSLTSIHVYNNNPVSISSGVFSNRANATLYVPKGAKAAYEAADYWKEFGEIVERNTVDVTMSAAGTRTFCSDQDLDFSEVSGLKAYIISGFSPSTGTLTLTPVTHVPSGTGLLLQGEPGDYDVPGLETDMYYTNLLKGVTEATMISPTEGEYTNFILANGAHGIGFYTLSESGELAAGKAYLQMPTANVPAGDSEARCFILDFENGDATGIGFTRVTTPKEDGVYYDLMGRRVKKPTKGIYIFNGKKVLIK